MAVTAKFRSFCFDSATSSFRLLACTDGWTTSRCGEYASMVTPRRSFDGSNGSLRVDRGADRQRADVAQQQRVAVGRRLGHEVGAEVAVGAGLVLDDHGLLERLRQRLADGAGDDVGRAARRVGHDDAQAAWPASPSDWARRLGAATAASAPGGLHAGSGIFMSSAPYVVSYRTTIRNGKGKSAESVEFSPGRGAGGCFGRPPGPARSRSRLLVRWMRMAARADSGSRRAIAW